MVGGFRYVNIHAAHSGAFSAGYAPVLVDPHIQQRNAVEQGVERAQRTQPLAEGAVEHRAQRDHRKEQRSLPAEEAAEGRPYAAVRKGKGDSPLEHSLWAEVLAKIRRAQAKAVPEQRRQQHYRNDENGVLETAQRL